MYAIIRKLGKRKSSLLLLLISRTQPPIRTQPPVRLLVTRWRSVSVFLLVEKDLLLKLLDDGISSFAGVTGYGGLQ